MSIGFVYSIRQAIKGNIKIHKRINLVIFTVTMIALAGFIGTVVAGFGYQSIPLEDTLLNLGPDSMTLRLNIHRCFSNPLFFGLILSVWSGLKTKKAHKNIARFTLFCWAGTLITALLFF